MIKFEAPAYNVVDTLEFKSPELGETSDRTVQQVIHRSRAGTIRTIIQTTNIGINSNKVQLEFKITKEDDAIAFRKFILKYKSDYIKYTDYDGIVWCCQYVDETLKISPSGPNGLFDSSLTLNRWLYA